MRKSSARPSTLFLMELIISILLFSLASAVCIQFLTKAYTVSHRSALLRNAEEHCTSVAEIITVSNSIEEFHTHINTLINAKTQDEEGFLKYSFSSLSDGYIDIFFDSSWLECGPDEAAYVLHSILTSDGRMLTGDVSIFDYSDYLLLAERGDEFTDKAFYTLHVVTHNQKEVQP